MSESELQELDLLLAARAGPWWDGFYGDLVTRALKPGGWFGLTCFMPHGGSGYTDAEVYERRSLGGLGYTEVRLREIWSAGLQLREVRPMAKPDPGSDLYGEDFLWVLLAQKSPGSAP